MERKLSVRKYLLAFLLTLAVFTGGVMAGVVLENARLEDARQITLSEKVSLRSLQLQQNYIESGLADCNALNQVLEATISELTRKMGVVMDYQKKAVFSEEEFGLQLRDYFLTEIQFLLIAQEIDRKCERDNVKILYFYDESAFDTQGDVLDYLRKLFHGRVLVFSFNADFHEEPMIRTLLASYNISIFPSVVVENRVFRGNTPVEVLQGEICTRFSAMKEVPEECGRE